MRLSRKTPDNSWWQKGPHAVQKARRTWEAGVGSNQKHESDGLSALFPSLSEDKQVYGGMLTL